MEPVLPEGVSEQGRPGGVSFGSGATSGGPAPQGGGSILGPGIISGNWGSSQLDTGAKGFSGGASWGR